ncbi:MAG: PTS sugar transporter subunit IIA [Alphaproteobacteria bacterium]|nr:PTS sugar transporter subunit IIA [Alphaproteobacteria bacterium]
MDLRDLIDANRVIFAARVSNKEQLLQDLASRAAALLHLDSGAIFDALKAREELGSTGLGNGFALPHAKIEGLPRLFGMFMRLSRPINFDAVDGQPVDLVFLLLVPETAGNEHLAALATISRLLREPEFSAKLRKAANTGALCDLLCAPRRNSA